MNYQDQFLPSILIVIATVSFLILERIFPGRELAKIKGWYPRALLINLVQLGLVGLGGLTWNSYFRDHALFNIGNLQSPGLEGFFIGLPVPLYSIGGID